MSTTKTSDSGAPANEETAIAGEETPDAAPAERRRDPVRRATWILLAVMIVSAVALVYINSSVVGLDADTPAARVSKVKILDDTEGSYGTAADAEKPLLVDEH